MRPQARVLLAIGAVVLAGLVAWVLIPPSQKAPDPGPDTSTLAPPPAPLPATTMAAETPSSLPVDPFATPTTVSTLPNRALDGLSNTSPPARGESTDPWDRALNEGRTGSTGNPFGGRIDRGVTPPAGGVPAPGTHTAPAATRTYTVQAGDSLYVISQRVLGSPKYVAAIQKANPKVDARRLKVGQVLNIPDVSTASTPAPTHGATPAPTDTAGTGLAAAKTYTVQAGDTLHKISTKLYGNTAMWEKLYALNRQAIGSTPNNLRVGMKLRLPAEPTTR